QHALTPLHTRPSSHPHSTIHILSVINTHTHTHTHTHTLTHTHTHSTLENIRITHTHTHTHTQRNVASQWCNAEHRCVLLRCVTQLNQRQTYFRCWPSRNPKVGEEQIDSTAIRSGYGSHAPQFPLLLGNEASSHLHFLLLFLF